MASQLSVEQVAVSRRNRVVIRVPESSAREGPNALHNSITPLVTNLRGSERRLFSVMFAHEQPTEGPSDYRANYEHDTAFGGRPVTRSSPLEYSCELGRRGAPFTTCSKDL